MTTLALTDAQIDEAAHELQRVIGLCGGSPTECAYDYLRGILAKLPAPDGRLVALREECAVMASGYVYGHAGAQAIRTINVDALLRRRSA
jgi:hypothetical protein